MLIALGWPLLIILKFGLRIVRSYLFLGSILLGMSGVLIWLYLKVIVGLPNVNEIYNPPRLSSKILDRNGVLLYKFYEDEDRSWVPLAKIPKSLVIATLAIEDKSFLQHQGISVKGISQALIYNMLKRENNGTLQGGSTITQQLVKSVFFSNEKTWKRKMREALLALMVEKKLSKEEILERYFNQVAYGGETYGVQEAAKKYFGKNVWEITGAEAAFLAGLPAAPSSYSPTGDNPKFGFLRQKHVISEMESAGFITEKEASDMRAEDLKIVVNRPTIQAPHFVFYVKDFLEKKLGYDNFARRGMTVVTSLDIQIQKMAEKIVAEEVSSVERLKITNGAAIVLSPGSGEVLAMVGSRNYFASNMDGKFNVTTALRQPGSSIKPINYLLALKKGQNLATIIDDEKVVYKIAGQSKPYIPVNYNGKYLGNVTLRTALASSLNIPSVKLLATNGVENMIDLAEQMGINTWKDKSRFGLSLALGAGEVKMTELASAYSIFANMGKKVELTSVLKIENYLGEKVFGSEAVGVETIDPKQAFLINSALSDNQARSPVFGLNSKLKIDNETVAVKTGTTNSLRDNWCIGWTNDVMVAAWVGNNDNSPMSWVASGVSGATPIWNKIMREMIASRKSTQWLIPPEGVAKKNVCGREEYFISGTEKDIKCPSPKATPTPQP
ncbi:transglycosylase domain-containing protein [Candidatus Shapirobacteria bacterium]|nr:transglycosylase domain-containing protein [Candidatus Shapirobacteria bacterium]